MQYVDHLIYAARDLTRGMDEIEAALGSRPAIGGRHPAYGTHNALLSLGPRTYLEIIAPDPALPRPERGRPFGLDATQDARLVTWVIAPHDLSRSARILRDAGCAIGAVSSSHRETVDGARLEWRLTDPYAMPLGGAVPFLIDWGSTPHPGSTAPRAGTLLDLNIEHPEPDRVKAVLGLLGLQIKVTTGPEPQLTAIIEGARGRVELR